MGNWQVTIQLVDDARLPLFRQIAAAIAADIERGRLRPGERLPSSRALCRQLAVNRNTGLAAYDQLRRRGVISGEPAKGTFVSAAEARRAPLRRLPDDPGRTPARSHPPA